jgi:hypothetical protein
VHKELHIYPLWKQSQYFFKHSEFLHLQLSFSYESGDISYDKLESLGFLVNLAIVVSLNLLPYLLAQSKQLQDS